MTLRWGAGAGHHGAASEECLPFVSAPSRTDFLAHPFRLAHPLAFAAGLGALVALSFAWFHFITWTQWASNHVFLHDAGVFDVICAGPVHGHFLRSPLAWNVDANYFAAHFRPILFLIMPFYFIVDHAMTYLTFQNAAMVAGAIPLALFARSVLRHDILALLIAALYLFHHFTGSVHLANHPEAIALPGMFLMFLGAHRRKPLPFLVGMGWALLVKEDFAIYTGAFCLSLLMERRSRREFLRWALVGIAVSVAWWVLAMVTIKLSGAALYHEAGNKPLVRFASLGETKPEIIVSILTNPFEIAGRLFRPMLLVVFAGTAFLALLDWRAFWLVILGAGVFLITDDPMVNSLMYYYSYPAIPFLFYSTVRGLAVLLEWGGGQFRVAPAAMGALLVALGVNAALPSRTDAYYRAPFKVSPRHVLAGEIAAMIPEEAAVAAQFDLYTRVSNREVKLPLRLKNLDKVDWVFLDLYGKAADLWGEENRAELEALMERVFSDEFETHFEGDGYFLRRRATPPSSSQRQDNESRGT